MNLLRPFPATYEVTPQPASEPAPKEKYPVGIYAMCWLDNIIAAEAIEKNLKQTRASMEEKFVNYHLRLIDQHRHTAGRHYMDALQHYSREEFQVAAFALTDDPFMFD